MRKFTILVAMMFVSIAAFLGVNCAGGEKECAHEYELSKETPPTCTEQGNKVYECKKCGDTYQEAYGEALGHDFGEWAEESAATCTEPKKEKRSCNRCGQSETKNVGEALGHLFGEWTEKKPATCTEAGLKERQCERCQETETQKIPASHDYELKSETQPTCTEGGKRIYECKVCHDGYEEGIPAFGHTPDGNGTLTESTCTEKGYTTYHCKTCDQDYQTAETEALGHEYEQTQSIEVSCEHDGAESYICKRCQEEYRLKTATRLVHTFGADGVCTTCGKSFLKAFGISVESGDNKSYAVSDTTYEYMIYAYDSTSYTHTLTIGREILEALVSKGYYSLTVQFGSPDANYRAFGYQWPGQTSVKYLNCFTYNGFGTNAMTTFTFGSKEGGLDESVLTADGLILKVYYRFAGNSEISSSEATNNAGAYVGTLGKYAVRLIYHQEFDPENAATYVTSDMTLENGEGDTVTFGGKAGAHTLTISGEAISYWMDHGFRSIRLYFGGKAGQTLAFQVTNFSGKPAGNGSLTIPEYVLTESMRSSGLKIDIFWRAFDNDNDKVDGMTFTVTPNPAANPEDPSTWLSSDYEFVYDAESAKYTATGKESTDKRTVRIKGEVIAAMMEQGFTQVKLSFSALPNQMPYFKLTVQGKASEGNKSLSKTVDLNADFAKTGMSFTLEYATLPPETWGGTELVNGFGFTVEFMKPEAAV